jgi:hypothetical protein
VSNVEKYEQYQGYREKCLELRAVFWEWLSEIAEELP